MAHGETGQRSDAIAASAANPARTALLRARAATYGIRYPLECPKYDTHGLLKTGCVICRDNPDGVNRDAPGEIAALEHAIRKAQAQ